MEFLEVFGVKECGHLLGMLSGLLMAQMGDIIVTVPLKSKMDKAW